jgi:uncharacterized protein (DUF433 family)
MDWRKHIVTTPDTRFGKPRIIGTRMAVEDVLGYLGSGMTFDEVLAEWDYLTRDQVVACVAYAAEMMRETQPADAA